MSDNKDNKIYKWGFAPGAEKAAQKFGFVRAQPTQHPETSKIEQILTGWGNFVKSHFVDLEPSLKEQGQIRLEICDGCDMRNGGTCSTQKEGRHVVTGEMVRGCGCRLAAKALSPSSRCPLGKW